MNLLAEKVTIYLYYLIECTMVSIQQVECVECNAVIFPQNKLMT